MYIFSFAVVSLVIKCIHSMRHSSDVRRSLKSHGTDNYFINDVAPQTYQLNNEVISFTIFTEPKPLSRHMSSKGFMYNPSAKFQKAFLLDSKEFLPITPLQGPLEMDINFYFTRPKSHYRTGKFSHELKVSAPLYHSGRRDIDNLIKFVLDALNKHAYDDDGQIAVIKSGKYYSSSDQEARIEVVIKRLKDPSDVDNDSSVDGSESLL